jgi:hypothetical protein
MMEQAVKFHHMTVKRKVKNSRVREMRHMILELVLRPLLLPALTCTVEVEQNIRTNYLTSFIYGTIFLNVNKP